MKRLLITLGDSWTSGYGLIDPETERERKTGIITDQEAINRGSNSGYDKEHAWPSLLSKRLGTEVLNLAMGGGSNPGAAKWLYEKELNLDEYSEVALVILTTTVYRLTFYRNKYLENLNVNDIYDHNGKHPAKDSVSGEFSGLITSYINFVSDDIETDFALETAYALKTIKAYCDSKDIMFYYGSIVPEGCEVYDEYFRIEERCLSLFDGEYNTEFRDQIDNNREKYMSYCGHPNISGHEKISDLVYHALKGKGFPWCERP